MDKKSTSPTSLTSERTIALANNHSHSHGLHHGHSHGSTASRIQFAFALNLIFALIEAIGGWLTGSVAILADAVHDLGDSLSLGLALFLEKRSTSGPSRQFSYGLKRLSLLSAVVTGIVLVVGSLGIAFESVQRLQGDGGQTPHTLGMLGLAVLGVTVNGLSVWRMSSGATHNERVLTWHLIEDLLGWLAIMVGALIMHFYELPWIDPFLALMISGVVLWNASKHLVKVTGAFLQAVPEGVPVHQLKDEILGLEAILDVHDLHVWTLDGEQHVLSLHVVVADLTQLTGIKPKIRRLSAKYGVVHATIEAELASERCAENCDPET